MVKESGLAELLYERADQLVDLVHRLERRVAIIHIPSLWPHADEDGLCEPISRRVCVCA